MLTEVMRLLWSWYEYLRGGCKKPEPIPLDAREKIYERDLDTLNRILYYYKAK